MKLSKTGVLMALSAAALASGEAQASWSFVVLDDSRASYASDAANNAYVGDPGGTSSSFYDATTRISPYYQQVVKAVAAESTPIDFVLFPGDMSTGKKPAPTLAAFDASLKTWWTESAPITAKGIPIYTVRGNHETGITSGGLITGASTTTWQTDSPIPIANPVTVSSDGLSYSFTHNGSQFIGIDQYALKNNGTAATDMTFLNSQLATTADHRFVFTHQPVWNNSSSELTSDAASMANAMNGKVDVLFTGHVHDYQRITKDGYTFTEEIVGTAGAPQGAPVLTGDPTLHIQATAGGNGALGTMAGPQMGYLLVTVNDDNTVTTQMKLLNNYTNATLGVTSFDKAVVAVPEPETYAMMTAGLGLLGFMARRRKQQALA